MSTDQTHDPTTPVHLKVGPWEFVPGIRRGHFNALLGASFFTIGIMTLVGNLQPYLFNAVMKVPIGEQGSLGGSLASFNEVVFLAIASLVGAAQAADFFFHQHAHGNVVVRDNKMTRLLPHRANAHQKPALLGHTVARVFVDKRVHCAFNNAQNSGIDFVAIRPILRHRNAVVADVEVVGANPLVVSEHAVADGKLVPRPVDIQDDPRLIDDGNLVGQGIEHRIRHVVVTGR